RRPLLVMLAFSMAGFAYAAPKLVPVLLFVKGDRFWDARAATPYPDRMTVSMLVHPYVDPYQHPSLVVDDQQRHRWHEYGNFMGSLGMILTFSSIAWCFAIRGSPDRAVGLSLSVTALVLLALSAGEFGSAAPASIAARLPLFSSFRIPSRYTIAF